jgi:hypothetical protein
MVVRSPGDRTLLAAEGTGPMAEACPKIRVAIGVFNDIARLTAAADALIALGLAPMSLCLAVERTTKLPSAALPWAATENCWRFAWFQRLDAHADASGASPDHRVVDLVAEALEAAGARSHWPRSSDGWSTINTHLSKGALLLAALVPSAPLQDQAVRVLLRHSPYPVHAEEFPVAAKPG